MREYETIHFLLWLGIWDFHSAADQSVVLKLRVKFVLILLSQPVYLHRVDQLVNTVSNAVLKMSSKTTEMNANYWLSHGEKSSVDEETVY